MKGIIFVSLIILSLQVQADDVYNFYFQKNAQNPEAAVTESLAPVQEVKTEVKPEKKPENEIRKMELGVYRSWITATSKRTTSYGSTYEDNPTRDSISVLASYRFNKYVGADGGFYMSTGWNNNSKDYETYHADKTVDGSLGLSITPIHLNVFGYELLEVGVIGGVMTMTKYVVKDNANGSGNVATDGDPSKIYGAYLGPRASINLTRDLGVVFDHKAGAHTAAITSVGLRYRF